MRRGHGGPPGVVSIQSKALSLSSACVRRTRGGHGGPPGVVSIQSKALSPSSACPPPVLRTRAEDVLLASSACVEDTHSSLILVPRAFKMVLSSQRAEIALLKTEVVYKIKFSLKISYSTHVCLPQFDKHQTSKPIMVSCEFNSH